MNEQFVVDENKRKELIREARILQRDKMLIGTIVYKLLYFMIFVAFFLITAWVVLMIIDSVKNGYTSDVFGFLGIEVAAFGVLAFMLLIPYAIYYCIEKKYMRKWVARKSEIVRLQKNSIFWAHYDRFYGKSYWEYKILYSDIEKIIYDKKEQILYVYGYMSGKEWDNINCQRCIDTIELNRNIKPVPWMTLPAYFEKFDELKDELSCVTDLKIIER